MNVRELILELQKIDNKEKEVYIFDDENNIRPIGLIDDSISDRVDINIDEVDKIGMVWSKNE